jgi:hypothetical protein
LRPGKNGVEQQDMATVMKAFVEEDLGFLR